MEDDRVVMVEELTYGSLKERWMALAVRYGAHHTVAEKLYQTIVRAYSEPWRRYHTLWHIEFMLDVIAEHATAGTDCTALAFSTWFHDVIYDTRRSDNEDRSAEFAANILRGLMAPESLALRASALILLTKQHAPPLEDADAKLFLDADLAILGTDRDTYRFYREGIRMEYSWVDDDHYRRARQGVLQEFLARDQIYRTVSIHQRCEAQARINLTEEIADLSGRD